MVHIWDSHGLHTYIKNNNKYQSYLTQQFLTFFPEGLPNALESKTGWQIITYIYTVYNQLVAEWQVIQTNLPYLNNLDK